MSIKIFSDFDGTITPNDVGHQFFQTFAEPGWEELIERWKRGLLSGKECLTRQCAMTRVTRKQLEEYSDAQKIDPSFIDFVEYCKSKGYPILILSDGLDFYIQRILKNYKLDFLKFYSNKLLFQGEDKVAPEFPYYKFGCKFCGNCKGYHIRKNRSPGERIIYIGDGYSDLCAIKEADLVFAKGDLLEYCQQNSLEAFSYENFHDVLEKLKFLEREFLS